MIETYNNEFNKANQQLTTQMEEIKTKIEPLSRLDKLDKDILELKQKPSIDDS